MTSAPEAFKTPSGLSVQRLSPNEIRIVRKWRYGGANVIIFIVWLGLGGASLAVPFVDNPSAALADQLAHMGGIAAFMLAIGYFPIALVSNRTVFRVVGADVFIRHGPLPWPGKTRTTIAGAIQFGIQRPPRRAFEKTATPDRILMGLNRDDQWMPIWKYNSRLVPQSHATGICRILERCAHHRPHG